MTRIINLFGGPGIGKSSIAAGLTYELKRRHISCDNPYEFPKLLAWDENNIAIKDQLYVLGNQHRGIVKSFNKVDYIIIDSPILLSLIYKDYYSKEEYPSVLYKGLFKEMVLNIHKFYDNVDIVLKRSSGNFNSKERYQTLDESIELDHRITNMLIENKINFFEIDVESRPVDKILNLLNIE